MNPCRVLLADNHVLLMEGVRSFIAMHPQYSVVGTAHNGLEALKMAKECHPHMVIMDISMPEMHGVDATRALQSRVPGARVIIYTMYNDQRFLLELIQAGIAGHVLKEDPPQMLLEAMERVREGGVYFSHNQSALRQLRHADTPAPFVHIEQKFPLFERLSKREREIFVLLAEGHGPRLIAEKLHISPKTAEAHKYNICSKLHITSLGELIKLALRHGIIRI